MTEPLVQVTAPLLSVNEPEAQVVEIFVTTGQKVVVGVPLCTLETTKATFEVRAEFEGYVCDVLVAKGQQVTVGAVLFEISAEPVPAPDARLAVSLGAASGAETPPEGLLITRKGLRLAKELGVPLNALPLGNLVTESAVREFSIKAVRPAGEGEAKDVCEVKVPFDANELLIIGARGHAEAVIDLVRQAGQYHLAGLVADPLPGTSEVLGVPVLGGEEALQSLYDRGVRLMANGVGAIERSRVRYEVFIRMAERGFAFPRLVHPAAVVEPSAEVAGGVQVFGMAYVGSAAHIGFGAVINAGAIVSHDCTIGDFAHLTPGVVLAGSVEVGVGAFIGMGVMTAYRVRIGEWARIGNGARINGDVPPRTIVKSGAAWP
jgi:sugar O-acyltransferase (sialic acid O-acetyltransferase NeuD family)